MNVRIRYRKYGKKNAPFFRLVVTDARNKRDGEYKANLGTYNPSNGDVKIDEDSLITWLEKGAQLSDNALTRCKKNAPKVMHWLESKKCDKRKKRRDSRRAKAKLNAANKSNTKQSAPKKTTATAKVKTTTATKTNEAPKKDTAKK
jgi:ribosomal protein S16